MFALATLSSQPAPALTSASNAQAAPLTAVSNDALDDFIFSKEKRKKIESSSGDNGSAEVIFSSTKAAFDHVVTSSSPHEGAGEDSLQQSQSKVRRGESRGDELRTVVIYVVLIFFLSSSTSSADTSVLFIVS